jgi:prephenate dehydrogenase
MPVFRKKFSEKIASSSYDQFSDRLVESINMVRELLKSNKELRENLEEANKKMDMKDTEIFDLEKEN